MLETGLLSLSGLVGQWANVMGSQTGGVEELKQKIEAVRLESMNGLNAILARVGTEFEEREARWVSQAQFADLSQGIEVQLDQFAKEVTRWGKKRSEKASVSSGAGEEVPPLRTYCPPVETPSRPLTLPVRVEETQVLSPLPRELTPPTGNTTSAVLVGVEAPQWKERHDALAKILGSIKVPGVEKENIFVTPSESTSMSNDAPVRGGEERVRREGGQPCDCVSGRKQVSGRLVG